MKLAIFALLLGLATTSQTAQAATIQLTQSGWDQGGPLTITFEGADTDASGYIEAPELTTFSASFALPGGETADWSLADLGADGFGFASTSDYFIKADSPTFTLYEYAFDGTYIAFISDSLGSTYLTGDPLQGTATPEPGSILLLSAGMGLIAVSKLKNRSR